MLRQKKIYKRLFIHVNHAHESLLTLSPDKRTLEVEGLFNDVAISRLRFFGAYITNIIYALDCCRYSHYPLVTWCSYFLYTWRIHPYSSRGCRDRDFGTIDPG